MERIVYTDIINPVMGYADRENPVMERFNPKEKLCALGFLVKFLENKEQDMKDAYIMCSGDNGDTAIYYSDAVLVFEEMIAGMVDAADSAAV